MDVLGRKKTGSGKGCQSNHVKPSASGKQVKIKKVGGSSRPIKLEFPPLRLKDEDINGKGFEIISDTNTGKDVELGLLNTKATEVAFNKVMNTTSLDSTYSDPMEQAKMKALGGVLDKLVKLCKEDDMFLKVGPSNIPSSRTQPYIASLLARRVLRGYILSPAAYDPFEKVCSAKVDNLMAFIQHDV